MDAKLDENKMLDEFGPVVVPENYEGGLGFKEILLKRRRDGCCYNIRRPFRYDFREAGMSGKSSHDRGTRGEQHPEINVRLGSILREHRQESFLCSGERGKQRGLANTCTGRRSDRSTASKTRFSLLAENLCNLCRSIKAIARTIGNICDEPQTTAPCYVKMTGVDVPWRPEKPKFPRKTVYRDPRGFIVQ